MLRTLGADLVGMSTTLEAIAAREAGAEVLGISLVTNLAAGMTGEPLDHQEVLAAGQRVCGAHGCAAGAGRGAAVNYEAAASHWLAEDPDPDTRAELSDLLAGAGRRGAGRSIQRAASVRHGGTCAARLVPARTG